jgi:hypothetical protein
MKSIQSPVTAPGKFKLAYGRNADMDVFSQESVDEHSEYMKDSFCVSDEGTQIFSDSFWCN